MYRMHIGTIVVCVGSSTVPAIRSFGWQYNASNGVVFRRQIGTESCRRVGSHAYRREILSGSYAYRHETCRFVFAGVADIVTDIADIATDIADVVNIAGIADRIVVEVVAEIAAEVAAEVVAEVAAEIAAEIAAEVAAEVVGRTELEPDCGSGDP